MPRFLISLEASRDLDEIVSYFQTYSLDAGDRFVAEFSKKCTYLTQFPNIGKRYPELHSSMRGILLDRYIIFYEVIEDGIIIARVVSASRDLTTLFEEGDN